MGGVLRRWADEPVGLLRSGSHYTYQRDGLGSITRILDSGKNPVNTYDYDPWGLTTASGSCKRHLRRVDLLVALRESL